MNAYRGTQRISKALYYSESRLQWVHEWASLSSFGPFVRASLVSRSQRGNLNWNVNSRCEHVRRPLSNPSSPPFFSRPRLWLKFFRQRSAADTLQHFLQQWLFPKILSSAVADVLGKKLGQIWQDIRIIYLNHWLLYLDRRRQKTLKY